MALIYQIPRNSLAWLLGAFVAVIAPHLLWLPFWFIVVAALCLIWRVQVHRGLWQFPRAWIKYLLAALSVFGLFSGFGRIAGLEPMVALLILGFSLKLLEMHRRCDALTVIYLAYVIAATQVLFEQTPATAGYMLFSVLLTTVALMGLNQSQGFRYPLRSLRLTGTLLLQSLPLMLLLFLLMPRLGALWSVPLQQHTAKTGVSDRMAPGDFSRLAESGELAFRVSFEGAVPAPNERYWRGLVFSRFDGREWSQAQPFDYFRDGQVVRWNGESALDWERQLQPLGSAVDYQVILEPTQQVWLYALMAPVSDTRAVGITRDYRLVNRVPVSNRRRYAVTSYLDYRAEAEPLPDWRYGNETRLPAGFNPRTLALAQQWYREAGNNTERFVERVLQWFNREFVYTLQPPRLGRHTADQFLFDSKRGFCEHFASSFAVMMRAAGIPARVVVGYQGGELNPYQNYLLVHQFDAHAWTEIWLPNQGWRRIDPTAAVAPQRIERGLQNMLSEEEFLRDSPLALIRYHHVRWLNLLRLQLDRIDYVWHRWVLGFDNDLQQTLLTRWLGGSDPARIGLALAGIGALILAVIAARLLLQLRQQPETPALRAFRRFCRRLAKLGLVRKPAEAPSAFAQRVVRKRPDLAASVTEITRLFERISYAGGGADCEAQLLAAVARFRPKRLNGGNAKPTMA